MSTNLSDTKLIPYELFKIIPKFDGDKRLLNFYLRKCEYVIDRCKAETHGEYLMHVLTSRLTGDAAALISDNEDIATWEQLKDLLTQHFGDQRSEASLSTVLQSLKINKDEAYTEFYRRIQSVKSALQSKINQITDINMRQCKTTFYNESALQVFLYNLPENIVSIVRMKSPSTLEQALNMVLDEDTFNDQYKTRNHVIPLGNTLIQQKPSENIKPQQTSDTKILPQQSNSAPVAQSIPNSLPAKAGFNPTLNLPTNTTNAFGTSGSSFGNALSLDSSGKPFSLKK